MRLPHDPKALACVLPDVPRWVETRSLLLSGRCVVRIGRGGDGAIVMDSDRRFPSGVLVGRADQVLLGDVLADVPDDFELLVQMDALGEVKQALRTWTAAVAVVHSPARPYNPGPRAQPAVAVVAGPDARCLGGLPDDIRVHAAAAEAVAVRIVDGGVVAICVAGDVTETLWDVGIDTLEGHRRRGYGTACFQALALWMADHGRQPVWAAYENYPPSRKLAAKLGFEPVDRIAVLTPGRPS